MDNRKQRAHDAAIAYWQNERAGRGDYLCNGCSTPISPGEGYLCKAFSLFAHAQNPPDLFCESCFDARPKVEPY